MHQRLGEEIYVHAQTLGKCKDLDTDQHFFFLLFCGFLHKEIHECKGC